MNLLRKVAVAVLRRLSIRDPAGWPVRESLSGEVITAQSALSLSAVWACVNLLSGTISTLPVEVFRTAANGTRTLIPDHPLYRLLHDSPNDDQTAVDFWDFMAASIELWGNAFAQIVRFGSKIVALIPIPPELMSVRRLYDTGTLEYSWSLNGKSYRVGSDEVLHIRGFGGNPLGGVSTLAAAANTFGLATSAERATGSMFRNGMTPSFALSFDRWLTDTQRKTAHAAIADVSGTVNAGKPLVLEGGTKIETLSIKPEDAQMLQQRGFSVEEICRFFGVPPFMVGHTEKTTSWGTGLEQQVLGFQKFTLRRRVKRIEQASMKQLLTPADLGNGIIIELNMEGLLRADSAARATFYQSGLQNGWITINEVRALENLPPVKGGDVPRMQSQNVPIDQPPQPAAALPPPTPAAGTSPKPKLEAVA